MQMQSSLIIEIGAAQHRCCVVGKRYMMSRYLPGRNPEPNPFLVWVSFHPVSWIVKRSSIISHFCFETELSERKSVTKPPSSHLAWPCQPMHRRLTLKIERSSSLCPNITKHRRSKELIYCQLSGKWTNVLLFTDGSFSSSLPHDNALGSDCHNLLKPSFGSRSLWYYRSGIFILFGVSIVYIRTLT